jgi:hypothetical protein
LIMLPPLLPCEVDGSARAVLPTIARAALLQSA